MSFLFLTDEDPVVAEAEHLSGVCYGTFTDAFWGEDPYNAIYERDIQELGLDVALDLRDENDTTESRRWERNDAIYHRWRHGQERLSGA